MKEISIITGVVLTIHAVTAGCEEEETENEWQRYKNEYVQQRKATSRTAILIRISTHGFCGR